MAGTFIYVEKSLCSEIRKFIQRVHDVLMHRRQYDVL